MILLLLLKIKGEVFLTWPVVRGSCGHLGWIYLSFNKSVKKSHSLKVAYALVNSVSLDLSDLWTLNQSCSFWPYHKACKLCLLAAKHSTKAPNANDRKNRKNERKRAYLGNWPFRLETCENWSFYPWLLIAKRSLPLPNKISPNKAKIVIRLG